MADRAAKIAIKRAPSRTGSPTNVMRVTLKELTTGSNCEGSNWKGDKFYGRTKALEMSLHAPRPARGPPPMSQETTSGMHAPVPRSFYGTQFFGAERK